MASSQDHDDYEEMLVEYERDVARIKGEATGKNAGLRPETVFTMASENAAIAAAALTN